MPKDWVVREGAADECNRLRTELLKIKKLAESDAPSEELEQAQHDLRRIHEIATAALKD